jgi:hypothetical protein
MGRNDYNISRMDDLNRTAFHLDAACARRDDEDLAERMGMPGAPCSGRKSYDAAGDA